MFIMKRILSLALTCIMVMSLFVMPMTTYAAYSEISPEIDNEDFTEYNAGDSAEIQTEYKFGKVEADATTGNKYLRFDEAGQKVVLSKEIQEGGTTNNRTPVLKLSVDLRFDAIPSNGEQIIFTPSAKDKDWKGTQVPMFIIGEQGYITVGINSYYTKGTGFAQLSKDKWYSLTTYIDAASGKQSFIIKDRDTGVGSAYLADNVMLNTWLASNIFLRWDDLRITGGKADNLCIDNLTLQLVEKFDTSFSGTDAAAKLPIIDAWRKTAIISVPDYYDDLTTAQKEAFVTDLGDDAFASVTAFNTAAASSELQTKYSMYTYDFSLKFDGYDTKLLTAGADAVGGVSDGMLAISGKADSAGYSSYLYDFRTANETYNTPQKQVLTFDYKLAQALASGSQTSFANIRNSGNTDQLAIATWSSGGTYKNFTLTQGVWYNFMIEINPDLGYVNEYCKAASDGKYTLVASTKKTIDNVGVLYLTSPTSGTAYFDNVKLRTLTETLAYSTDYTVEDGIVKNVPSTMTASEFLAKVSVTEPVKASVINTTNAQKYASGAKLDENAALLIHTNEITGQLYPIELVYPDYEYDIRYYNGAERIYSFNKDIKSIKATLDMTNNLDANANVMFILAAYDNGVLVAAGIDADTKIAASGKVTTSFEASITIPQDVTANELKAFVWDNNQKPYLEEADTIPFVTESTKPTLYLVGSSHTDSYEHSANDAVYPQMGWGKYISYYLSDDITVDNRARAGYTTDMLLDVNNYAVGYRWHDYKDSIKAGDYVLFCIGYNDGGSYNIPNDRYIANLTTMYNDVVAAGATPIYETPNISLGAWDSTGAWTDHSAGYGQGLKRDALIEFAASIDAPLINGGQGMADLFNAMYADYMAEHTGATEAKGRNYIRAYFGMYLANLQENPATLTYSDAPGFGLTDEELEDNATVNKTIAELKDDTLHLNVRGAYRIAQMVRDSLKKTNSSINKYFIDTPKAFDGYQNN